MLKTNGDLTTKPLSITIVIPTVYKPSVQDLRQALLSLSTTAPTSSKLRYVVFVDRATADFKEKDYLKKLNLPFKVSCMWSCTPVGFTGAINQALQLKHRQHSQDWFLVFNDDAQAKSSFWQLKTLLNSQRSGVVSCAIETLQHTLDSNGLAPTRWGVTLPVQRKIGAKRPLFVGTCFFVHGQTVKQLFDQFGFFFFPLFFAYAEDFELSVRLHRMQIPIVIDQQVRVKHAGSTTAGRGSFFQLFHGLRNDAWVHILHQHSLPALLWYGVRYGLYLCLLSLYKGYWLLPIKVIGSTVKNLKTVQYWRHIYDQSLADRYTF
mgnify:CR=1 FL=1